MSSPRGRAKRVALWGDPRSRLARSLERSNPGLRLLVLDPLVTDQERHGRLAGAGPFDLVIDDSGRVEGAELRFEASFLNLKPGGHYRVPARSRDVAAAVLELTRLLRGPVAKAGGGSAGHALGAAVADVQRGRRWLEVRRAGRTLAKLREPEMNVALAEDPSRGRILATVPGVSFESRCAFSASREKDDRRRARYHAPDLFLREYRDVVCRPKSVVQQRGLLTPDTFRHHQAGRLRHRKLRDAGPRYAVAPGRRAVRRLEGTYFHLDNEHRGFFGHALTEQVSRLWAWRTARERYPDVRVLVSLNRGRGVADWEWTLLEAAGIRRQDVVVIDGPVKVERLLAATPMFSMPAYVHPEIVRTWDEVGQRLLEASTAVAHPTRIFCSRRHDKRACLNGLEIHELFAEHGFEIVFPEDRPLPDQVAMFHHAEVVAGFAGSAMFTTMFTDRRKHLVVVAADTYRPSNEYLISSVRGHRLDVAVGTTPKDLPPGVPRHRPLRWPFQVDLDREGVWLRSVLAEL